MGVCIEELSSLVLYFSLNIDSGIVTVNLKFNLYPIWYRSSTSTSMNIHPLSNPPAPIEFVPSSPPQEVEVGEDGGQGDSPGVL
jgi:hypothetical protein